MNGAIVINLLSLKTLDLSLCKMKLSKKFYLPIIQYLSDDCPFFGLVIVDDCCPIGLSSIFASASLRGTLVSGTKSKANST